MKKTKRKKKVNKKREDKFQPNNNNKTKKNKCKIVFVFLPFCRPVFYQFLNLIIVSSNKTENAQQIRENLIHNYLH